ncbi:hypothetical protein JMJ77_0014950, partial [Colletotrichum scovillei]
MRNGGFISTGVLGLALEVSGERSWISCLVL